jgi:hypothetical protein
MNANQIWQSVESVKAYILSWVWWFLAIVFPVVLLLLIIKGTEPANMLGKYVPLPSDINFWLYAAGIYWLVRGSK